MSNEELEKILKAINSKLTKLLNDLYFEDDKLIETCSDAVVPMDAKLYKQLCDYLDTDDIDFMGLS